MSESNGPPKPPLLTEVPIRIADVHAGTSFRDAALASHAAGFAVIPIVPGTKRPAVKWDEWLGELSPKSIRNYWMLNPDHELGFILNARQLVLDADTPLGITALDILEQTHGVESNLVVNTRRGQHRYYLLGDGVFAKTSSHATADHPERIDVKVGRSLVIAPPSLNKVFKRCDIVSVDNLAVVGRDFVDAVYLYNGSEPPRPVVLMPRQPRLLDGDIDQTLAGLRARVAHLDPDTGYSDWLAVLMAIHYETGGSEEGFETANEWSARGKKYEGERALRAKWQSFAGYIGPELTVGTINAMLSKQGIDWAEIAASAEPDFVEVEHEESRSLPLSPAVPSILASYSIAHDLDQLRQVAVEQRFVLYGIAVLGQATVLYASPNTGKTLLVIWMLIESIKDGRLDPAKLFYVNCDDSLNGLLVKGEIARTYGFHMLADGWKGFEVQKLRDILGDVMASGQASGAVLVLDTLKKFTDLMSKRDSTEFMKPIRQFVLQGGTVIMLAHANKNRGADNKPQYAGVADILDDVDVGYIMWVTSEAGSDEYVVEFEARKRRGNVMERVVFAYGAAADMSYEELLASVRRVESMEVADLRIAAELRADAPIIEATKACISAGIAKRMELVAEVARRTKCGRRKAETVLDAYAGENSSHHHWNYRVGPRGAKIYHLLGSVTVAATPDGQPPLA